MKNQFNFNSFLIYAFFLAGTFILAYSCADNKQNDSRKIAEKENIERMKIDDKTIVVVQNDNDTRFLMDVAEMQQEKISLGKLAQQKSNAVHVKRLGELMEIQHNKSYDELRAIARSKSISIPSSPTQESRNAYEKLEKKTGIEFDNAYCKLMIEHHEDAIGIFENAAARSEDPNIRAWASQQLPTLRTHLDHAKACKAESDKAK